MSSTAASDPFAAHRTADNNPFSNKDSTSPVSTSSGEALSPTDTSNSVPLAKRDRRLSKEWDAAKTPPSRFQKVEGSIYATPASRDGHVARNKIHGFKEKVLELSGVKK